MRNIRYMTLQNFAHGLLQLLGLLPLVQEPAAAHTEEPPAHRPLLRTPRATLFLDFDGVLHSGNSGTFALLPSLEEVLREYSEIDIVLSTSWRTAEVKYLQHLFDDDIASRVIGVTPHFDGQWARGREIMDIVSRYGIQQWVVLDDDKRLFSPDFPNVIFTDFRTGLTPARLKELAERFEFWRQEQSEAV